MRLFFFRRMIPQIVLFFYVCLFCQIAQAQEPKQDAPQDTKKMLNDPEFRRIFEELSVTKNGNSPLFGENKEHELATTPPKSQDREDTQKSVSTFNVVLAQHLAQIDRTKYLLIQNLDSAGTYGFRKIAPTHSEETDFSQGTFVSTSQPLDLAIHGNGFFVVKFRDDRISSHIPHSIPPPFPALPLPSTFQSLPSPSLFPRNALAKNAVFYTRCGHFYLTAQRKIAIQHAGFSFLLQPEITVPFHAVSCEYRSNGDFLARMSDGSPLKIGELKLVRFDLPKNLERLDGVLFRLTPGSSGPEMENPNETVQSGQLETSNVDVAETLETYRRLHELQTLLLEKLKYTEAG